jgi:hypothetical protein
MNNYARKGSEDGETVGIEGFQVRELRYVGGTHGLTVLAGQETLYDPRRRERMSIQVSVTRRS